jgi:hypothetical protein
LLGGHVIASVAAKHPDFRMMRNARQLANKDHRHIAMLANGRWDFAVGRRHERNFRLSKQETAVTSPESIPAPELVKIVRLIGAIRAIRYERKVNVFDDLCSMTKGQ